MSFKIERMSSEVRYLKFTWLQQILFTQQNVDATDARVPQLFPFAYNYCGISTFSRFSRLHKLWRERRATATRIVSRDYGKSRRICFPINRVDNPQRSASRYTPSYKNIFDTVTFRQPYSIQIITLESLLNFLMDKNTTRLSNTACWKINRRLIYILKLQH